MRCRESSSGWASQVRERSFQEAQCKHFRIGMISLISREQAFTLVQETKSLFLCSFTRSILVCETAGSMLYNSNMEGKPSRYTARVVAVSLFLEAKTNARMKTLRAVHQLQKKPSAFIEKGLKTDFWKHRLAFKVTGADVRQFGNSNDNKCVRNG
eukprot:1161976-Pelagomonas_calceolata.AAC.4